MSSNPLRDLFFPAARERALVEALAPRRTFADVILPPSTRRALDQALVQIQKHDMLFGQWGLGERHDTGLGLAFNFAGPPGTGKTICAEAIAHALGKRLLVVRYAELESQWAGVTAKNVAAVFASATEQEAVLFFDEADAVASRRFTSMDHGYQREANAVVNVLLREVESFSGVVIFATNLAANFDPAFERRIRTHILFEMPGPAEREQIWRAQLHSRKTPLDEDVDFRALAERYPASGGDIKNAVLKAAQIAIGEPGPDAQKRISQRHFVAAMEDVISARRVMDQSLFGGAAGAAATGMMPWAGGDAGSAGEEELGAISSRLVEVEDALVGVPARLDHVDSVYASLRDRLDAMQKAVEGQQGALRELLEGQEAAWAARLRSVMLLGSAALVVAIVAVVVAILV
jgi:hypothetical protein